MRIDGTETPRMMAMRLGFLIEKDIDQMRKKAQIGDKVKYYACGRHGEQMKRTGVIIQKEKWYAVLQTNGYRECITWIDLIIQSARAKGVRYEENSYSNQ